MKQVESLHIFDQIKLLADSRRMKILRLLMTTSATLTHLARSLGQSPRVLRDSINRHEESQ